MARFRPAASLLAALALWASTAVLLGAPAVASVNSQQPNRAAVAARTPAQLTAGVPVAASASNGAWTVYHRDNAHTGNDGTLPKATGATAGWTSTTLDGSIYAEPLVYNGLVYVATLNNTVYALDQSTGAVVWPKHLRAPKGSGWSCGNVSPQGILGTPVIDAAGGRIYVATFGSDNIYRLEGLNLATGVEELTTVINTSPVTSFDWTIEQERGALGLANGYVYVPFGGRWGDCGAYHGWVFAVPTNGGPVTHFYVTPGDGAGFWSSGGVVIDDSTGKVFETSGNGVSSGCDANPNGTPVYENDAVVRLSATLAHEDAFIPLDWQANWCQNDMDLGSASMVLINPSLAFQAGKWGSGFLVNPKALGGMNGQLYPSPAGYTGVDVCLGNHADANFGSYAYAAPYVYLSCEGNGLVALQVNTSTPSFSNCDASCVAPSWNAGGFAPGPPIVAGGAVWAVDVGGAGLYGFDAASGAQIYHSAGFGVRHFTTPSEAGGQIFVGADNVVRSFNMTLNACLSVTASATPASPQPSGTPVAFTGVASGCPDPSPLYQFWILAPGGSWKIMQPFSTNATFNWTTTGLLAGTYLYTVWVRDASSPGATCNSYGCYDALFPGTAYKLTTTACTSVGVTASPATPQGSGTPVTFTGSGSGCPNPLYQFWILAPGGAWKIVQPFSATATFNWNTTGLVAGTYLYTVWVRDAASTGTTCNSYGCYDALFPGTAYKLTTTACTSLGVTASPASPQGSGTPVTFTGAASTCPHPIYQFWILAPGGAWKIVQAFSTTAAFNWNTTGQLAGTYMYTVWVRDSGSAGTTCNNFGCYDAIVPGTAYALTTTRCTGLAVTPSPASPQASGTPVTFTGVASTCPHPIYQFWVLAPGGSWKIVQAFSTTATFNWTTTGLAAGTYMYTVWVRDSGSAGSTCNNFGCYDAIFPGTAYTLT